MTSKIAASLDREQLLGGLPGPKAGLSLFAIESRVAHLVALAQQEAAATYLTPASAEQRERAFLEAIASGHRLPIQPTIQDIEHYAHQWAWLAPQDPGVRAVLAQLLGQKYHFTRPSVPQLRQHLGLDDPAVQSAFQRLYERPLETIYAPQVSPAERLRWAWAALSRKLDAIPPFWLAFFLTLPGATGLLSMPIALAHLSLSTALALLVIFGGLTMLTAAMLSEAVMRSGTTHFGLGFLGPLAQEYLGKAGGGLLGFHLFTNNLLVLVIFYLGVAGTLQDATGLPAEAWIAAIFLVCLYFLNRRSLNATVSTSLLVVFVVLAILLLIPLLALPHFDLRNLAGVAAAGAFTPAAWGPVLGILLATYYSPVLVAAFAPAVLRRAPDGRAWMRGSASSIFALTLIACLWEVVAKGSLPPAVLAGAKGTLLSPLAAQVGPLINWLGAVLVILGLGLTAIQDCLVLYYATDDMLPKRGSLGVIGRLDERSRFLLAGAPVGVSFLLTEWVAWSGFSSFTTLQSVLGVLQLPLMAGIYPVLLLLATRRKGDLVPTGAWGWLGNRLLLAGVYLVYLAIILVHGWIWPDLPSRVLAVGVALTTLWMTVAVLRGGALSGRVVVELRHDQRPNGRSMLQVVQAGRPVCLSAILTYPAGEVSSACGAEIADLPALEALCLDIPARQARQLKVWAHRLTPEGRSEVLPLRLEVLDCGRPHSIDLSSAGTATIDISAWPCSIRLSRISPV